MDYLTLLLNTYINEKEIFSEVIQNRQIQFEKEQSISKKEFYFNCRKVVENFKSQIDNTFSKRQNELYQIIYLKEEKGEPTKNIEKELKTIHKNQFPINLLHLTADKFRGNFYLTDVEFIETSLNETQYISKHETKNILTNETYYSILEKCSIEAFESLKLKALYPKNGTKAIWDISSLTITKGDGLPTEKDNDLFRKEYILDNMRVTFLMALDRFSKSFENKHSITRDIFYKKCYQSILLKTSQSSLWQEPDFGFDIDKQPCKLTFIWNMRTDIEARSKETKQSKPQQNPPEQTNTNNTDEVKKSHPKHNPNDWNTDCFEFFKYLFDEYYNDKKRTNTKLICIWFYLSEYNPEKYILKITKDNYKIFIKKNFGITITNTDKPQNYDSKVLSTLHEHRKNFEDSLK